MANILTVEFQLAFPQQNYQGVSYPATEYTKFSIRVHDCKFIVVTDTDPVLHYRHVALHKGLADFIDVGYATSADFAELSHPALSLSALRQVRCSCEDRSRYRQSPVPHPANDRSTRRIGATFAGMQQSQTSAQSAN